METIISNYFSFSKLRIVISEKYELDVCLQHFLLGCT